MTWSWWVDFKEEIVLSIYTYYFIMRSQKCSYSAHWRFSQLLYKSNWYISFVSIFNHSNPKWKSSFWLNCLSFQFELFRLMDCRQIFQLDCRQKTCHQKSCHQKKRWNVSPEVKRKHSWIKTKSVLFLQVKSTQFKIFW